MPWTIALLAPNVSAAFSKAILRFTLSLCSARLALSWLPRYSSNAVADGNVDIGVMFYRNLKVK